MSEEIPLFPLGTGLFPGGPLPLRIFETRYVDMVRRCMREESGFGVVLIERGAEAGAPSRFVQVGTEAGIVDFDRLDDGLLGLTCVGRERFRVLDAWRQEIESLYGGTSHHPISHALAEPARTFDLKKADFLAVIDGMEMDAYPRVRIADLDELTLYCDRVAGAVGRLCVRIFGLGDAEGILLSADLGQALQLTNILRDIVEDAARDRVYLPADLLVLAGAGGDGVEDIVTAPGLPALCDKLAAKAEQHFDGAAVIIAKADPVAARPAVMMMHVYHRILAKLQKRGWQSLEQDVGPSRLEKIMIAVRYGIFG